MEAIVVKPAVDPGEPRTSAALAAWQLVMKRMAAAIDQQPRASGYPASARVPASADNHKPIDQIADPPGLGQDGK